MKYMETSEENFHVDAGAKRAKSLFFCFSQRSVLFTTAFRFSKDRYLNELYYIKLTDKRKYVKASICKCVYT